MGRRRTPVELVNLQQDLHCSVDEQRRLLGESPFFRDLSTDDVVRMKERFRQRHFAEGTVIQRAGDRAEQLAIVAAGTVRMSRPTPDGQDVLLNFLGPGEHFGSLAELGDDTYREDVVAHTECCVLSTTAVAFREILLEYPIVAMSSLQIVAARLREAQGAIEQLSAYPVERRLATTLLQLADKRGERSVDGTLIQIPLSRQDLADMTGARVETVSRVISEFRRSGLIDSGRRWVAVVDRDALGAIARLNS